MRTIFLITGLRRSIRLAELLPIVFLGLTASACSDRDPGSPSIGDPFPLVTLAEAISIGDKPVAHEGKTLLINFWATWCAPCRDEMPELQALSDEIDPERYAVIGVAVDEDRNLALEFLLEHGIRFTNFQDPDRHLATRLLGIETYPASFIVSPGGIIQRRIHGRRSWNADSLGFSSISAETRLPREAEYQGGN